MGYIDDGRFDQRIFGNVEAPDGFDFNLIQNWNNRDFLELLATRYGYDLDGDPRSFVLRGMEGAVTSGFVCAVLPGALIQYDPTETDPNLSRWKLALLREPHALTFDGPDAEPRVDLVQVTPRMEETEQELRSFWDGTTGVPTLHYKHLVQAPLLEIVKGTPAATPSPPSPSAGAVPLLYASIAPGDSEPTFIQPGDDDDLVWHRLRSPLWRTISLTGCDVEPVAIREDVTVYPNWSVDNPATGMFAWFEVPLCEGEIPVGMDVLWDDGPGEIWVHMIAPDGTITPDLDEFALTMETSLTHTERSWERDAWTPGSRLVIRLTVLAGQVLEVVRLRAKIARR